MHSPAALRLIYQPEGKDNRNKVVRGWYPASVRGTYFIERVVSADAPPDDTRMVY